MMEFEGFDQEKMVPFFAMTKMATARTNPGVTALEVGGSRRGPTKARPIQHSGMARRTPRMRPVVAPVELRLNEMTRENGE